METNIRNIRNNSNTSNGPEKTLCPVCLQLQATETMRDVEIEIGNKKHLLAVCDSCYEKHIKPKREKSQDEDFPF